MLAALLLIVGIMLGVFIATATYATELGRIATFLREHDLHGNARVTAGTNAPGLAALIDAANGVLDRATRERVSALREREGFQRDLAALSHDIRTPLAGARGYLQLANGENDAQTREHHLAAAMERIDSTTGLLDALFAYTRSADPDLSLEHATVAVQPLVERALLSHYPTFEELGWEPHLTCADSSPSAWADADALARIMDNLLVNAIRYGTTTPEIEIADEGNQVRISVANRVANPDAIDTSRLFERFYRADHARGATGAGLGLAVCKNLAEAMGATIEAHLAGSLLSIDLVLPSAARGVAPDSQAGRKAHEEHKGYESHS